MANTDDSGPLFYRCSTCGDYLEQPHVISRPKPDGTDGYETVHAAIVCNGGIHDAAFCGPCVRVPKDRVPVVTIRLTDNLHAFLKYTAKSLGEVTLGVAGAFVLRRAAAAIATGILERRANDAFGEVAKALVGETPHDKPKGPAVH